MRTQIIFDDEAREKIYRGVNLVAKAVGTTLGPRGRNVAIAKADPKGEIYERVVVHDGVTVAKFVDPEDEFENLGAAILRQAAQKQVDEVGDGTTAVIVLAKSIINESLKRIKKGDNPMALRKTFEEGAKKLTNELQKIAMPIKTYEEIKQVATISAEDEELGELIAKTLKTVGKDGVVTVEESKGTETVVEHQEGMQIDKGYFSPYFITDPQTMTATHQNVGVLVTDIPVTNIMELAEFIEKEYAQRSKQLVIIAPDFGGDALPSLVASKLQNIFVTLCVQAPSFGEYQRAILEDISIVTGGRLVSKEAGRSLRDVKIEDIGIAEYVKSTKNATIIVGKKSAKDTIEARVNYLRQQINDPETSEYNREKMRERLAKLSNGVALIKVGGQTEIEMKERKERVLDAVAATRMAMLNGIVPGGEISYLQVRDKIFDNPILYDVLEEPFQLLIKNAGIDLSGLEIDMKKIKKNYGIDVIDGKVKDMIKAGIIDPVAVPIQAIKNAVSVAIQLITTNALIVPNRPKDEK
jgi:chaperonin GroEL